MKIERLDVYWARLPLAFVWKTSYGGPAAQRHHPRAHGRRRAARLGRELSGAHPLLLVGAHPRHLSHRAGAHGPAHHRPGDRDLARPPRPPRLHQGQRVRARRAGHRLVGAGREAPGRAAARGAGRNRRPRHGGRGFRRPGLLRHPARQDPGRDRRGLPADQAQVPPRLGPGDGGGGALDLSALHLPRRLQCRLYARRRGSLPRAGPSWPRHDRAAARGRRHEPGESRRSPAPARDAGLPRRERAEPRPCPGGHPSGELPGGEYQDGARGRPHRLARDPGPLRRARHPLLGGRHARERGGRRHLRRARHPAQLHLSG